jgi:U3 small nucleolar RNA-associated protein 6
MAEHVQASLDQMVAPLRDLMDRNIFSDKEIRSIVSRRRESEYLLRRRAARKADFIRYIDSEMILEKLRALRTAKKKRDHRKSQKLKGIDIDNDYNNKDDNDKDGENKNDDDKDKQKDHIGDIHIVQHIHLLFVRVIRKFRGDISLHLRHAEFCKDVKSYTRLGRVYAEALQIFPRESGLWIEAASNEFFGQNRSVKGARVLLQRSLRINEHNQELWLQYFTLELHYAQTLKGRQRILHPEKDVVDQQDSENDNENNVEGGDGDNNNNNNHDYYKIPLVIVRNAILAIPNSIHFRLQFLDVCQKFPDTSDLMDYVQDSMSRDFATEPESWIARAVYEAGKKKQQDNNDDEEQKLLLLPKTKKARTTSSSSSSSNDEDEDDDNKDPVVKVLQEAINAIPTSEMLIQAFRFAEDYRNELLSDDNDNDDDDVITSVAAVKEEVDGFIRNVWTKAEGMDSSDLAMEQTHYLLNNNNNNVEEAVKIIKAYCTKSRKTGVGVVAGGTGDAPCDAWILWTSLVAPLRKQKTVLERAVRTISMDTHPDYVTVLLQLFGAQMKMIDEMDDDDNNDDEVNEKSLFNTLQKIILLAPKTVNDVRIEGTGLEFELTDVFTAYLACLNFFFFRNRSKGIQGARSVYESVLFRSTVTLSNDNVEKVKIFIDRCIKLEQQELDTNTTGKKKRQYLCKLYDKAVGIFKGTSLEDSYREDRNEKGIFGGTVSS